MVKTRVFGCFLWGDLLAHLLNIRVLFGQQPRIFNQQNRAVKLGFEHATLEFKQPRRFAQERWKCTSNEHVSQVSRKLGCLARDFEIGPFVRLLLTHPSVQKVSEETGKTTAQVLLRWALQQEGSRVQSLTCF